MTDNYSRPPINSGEFNIREITKQLILLEDHLSDDDKYCVDCIHKHLLTVEGLAEESVAMEPRGRWAEESRRLSVLARSVMMEFSDGVPKADLAQRLRTVRKKLASVTYDPRVGMSTVKSILASLS